jgi:hypothetical protein
MREKKKEGYDTFWREIKEKNHARATFFKEIRRKKEGKVALGGEWKWIKNEKQGTR